MRSTAAFLLVAVLLAGCGGKLKRLSDAEHDHYYALKIWMSEDQQKQFLSYKTEQERSAWLKEQGLWERFYQYDDARRRAIVAGEVASGWKDDQVLMSWGQPYERRRLAGRPASRSELLVYRFEVDRHGFVRVWKPGSNTAYKAVSLHQVELAVDDGVVAEMTRKERWE